MADRFLRSTDGSDADNGTTWALAKATRASAHGVMSAGDRLFIADAHDESTAGSVNSSVTGDAANPTAELCVDDTGDPSSPTTLATTGIVRTTGANVIDLNGSLYGYGVNFKCGTGGTSVRLAFTRGTGQHVQAWESCLFETTNTGAASGGISVGPDNSSSSQSPRYVYWRACSAKFGANQGITMRHCRWEWFGGAVDSSGTAPSTLFRTRNLTLRGCETRLRGVDLSHVSGTLIDSSDSDYQVLLDIAHCKLHASVTARGTLALATYVRIDHSDSADAYKRFSWHQGEGDIYAEHTVVRTGGAQQGGAGIAHRMVSLAGTNRRVAVLVGPESYWWLTSGASTTVTISILSGGASRLTDAQVYIEVDQLGTSGVPLSVYATDAPATQLTAAANQADDTGSAWDSVAAARANSTAYSVGDIIKVASNSGRLFICTAAGTSAGSEPGGYATAADGDAVTDSGATFRAMWRQKIAVTFTPQETGWVRARAAVAGASLTVYADRALQVA